MAAFYFDKIKITKNLTGSGIYDFEATSNEGFVSSGNPVTEIIDVPNGDCEYAIPNNEANIHEVNFPTVTVDFSSNIFTADKLFTFVNKYPQYGATDFKGGFSVKDTKYPPPRHTKAYPISNFEKSLLHHQPYIIPLLPKIMLAVTITGRFEFTSIELFRVMDKTYTAKIVLTDIGIAAEYVAAGMSVVPDKSMNNKSILVLSVQKSGTPDTVLTFDRPNLYLPLGDSEMPVIIYDATDEPASSVALKDIGFKNASLYFD